MQSLLLVAIVILFCGLLFLVRRWPQGTNVTFSVHAAAYPHTILYYIVLFSIVLPILLLFFIGWFGPTFHLSPWFTLFIVCSSVTQYVVTLIPEVGGWKTTWHRIIAFFSASLLLPALGVIVFSPVISQFSRSVSSSMCFVILGIMIIFATKKKPI